MVFLFVDQSSKPERNVRVRAHAAKEAHAIVRRKRMAEYRQQQQQQKSGEHGRNNGGGDDDDDGGGGDSKNLKRQDQQQVILLPIGRRGEGMERGWYHHHQPSPTGGGGVDQGPEKAWYGDSLGTMGISLPREQSHLIRHYIQTMIPMERPAYEENHLGPRGLPDFGEAIARYWVPAALSDEALFLGMLMCSARDLYGRTGHQGYDVGRMRYKAACLPLVRGQIEGMMMMGVKSTAEDGSSGREEEGKRKKVGGDSSYHYPSNRVNKMVLLSMLQLASDDFMTGDLAAFDNHVKAIFDIVGLCGGMQNLDEMGGLLRRAVEVMTWEGFGSKRREMGKMAVEGEGDNRKGGGGGWASGRRSINNEEGERGDGNQNESGEEKKDGLGATLRGLLEGSF